MNITSMLNCSAAEQQRRAENISSTRTRTVWDAGGYSLPINTLSVSQDGYRRLSTGDVNQVHSLSEVEPSKLKAQSTSPGHKFSDSRSSLSSITSSSTAQSSATQSNTHSRFSSMSTVNSLSTENPSIDHAKRFPAPDAQEGFTFIMDSSPRSPVDHRPTTSSPTGSLDALALVAEHRLSGRDSTPPHSGNDAVAGADTVRKDAGRPGSPSDALMIKRATLPSLSINTRGGGEFTPDNNDQYLSAPLESEAPFARSKSHKRAISAPDFPRGGDHQRAHGLNNELTPPSSQHPDVVSPTPTQSYLPPDTPPATSAGGDSNAAPKCMYITNCDTGSQPRKAISHIFGRNKMCTRLIPQSVWVHYCRKHYQRSRYRNPKEYAKLQCDLVQQQIKRVHAWSDQNKQNGDAGVVQDWGLAVRKREQKRLDDLGGANRKRRASAFERNNDDDGEDDDGGRGAVPITAVPDWLLALCGKGYTTNEILEVFNRLHQEILDDQMPCFPDIEILPNIVVDQEEPKSPKGYAKRKPLTATHKRSQSLGVTKPDYFSPDRRPSQAAGMWDDEMDYDTSPQKRRRQNELNGEAQYGMGLVQRGRLVDRPTDGSRRLVHRPVFSNIEEHGAVQDYNAMRGDAYSRSPASYQAPLPAPTPQRMNPRSITDLEANGTSFNRRPVQHQRTHSDIGGAINRNSMQFPSLSAGLMQDSYQTRSSATHYQSYDHPNGFAGMRQGQANFGGGMRQMSGGHNRHQSSPMIQGGPYTQSAGFSFRDAQVQGQALPPLQTPALQNHNNTLSSVMETPDTRALYSSRR